MADLNHTTVSRKAAAIMLAATVNEAAQQNILNESLLHPYLNLCQDIDTQIRKSMIANFHILLPRIKDKQTDVILYDEVRNQS
jgi:hypothetical protein